MAAATVAVTSTLPQRAVSNLLTLVAIPITVTYATTAYATATGGLPFDLFALLAASGPFSANLNYKDIIALIPLGTSAEKFVVDGNSFAIGTATSTTLPCTVRIYGTGSANKAALTEVDDANLTGSFKALLMLSRSGQN